MRDLVASDEREQTILLVDALALQCKELAPMIVLFYAPPYYPAVCSTDEETIQALLPEILKHAKKQYNIDFIHQNYFSGLSDLSYIGTQVQANTNALVANMPVWGRSYTIPLDMFEKLAIPVLNMGPWGKDAHKMTERLQLHYSLEFTREMLEWSIHRLWKMNNGQ